VLTLSRKRGETICIGDNIFVTIVDIIGTEKVKLGVMAPRKVPVHRKEVAELIKKNLEAPVKTVFTVTNRTART
jgi:carbon storage regulator